jgi:DNA-binding response OmpR family regulator
VTESTRKILIIEDNLDIQEIYRLAFEEAGYTVMISINGLLGITDIVDFMPDVVVLDIMMPEMNGYEFLKALKNNTSLSIPVVVVSNLAQESDRQQALDAGAVAYLVKADYSSDELVAKVGKYVRK